MHRFIFILGILALTGCHRSAELSASPSSLGDCGSSTHSSTVTVRWNAAKATKGGPVKLWAHNPDAFSGNEPTLWIGGSPVGSAVTGKWALPGTQIKLTDAATGKTLAEISIDGSACKQ
jgi:hypothetical protein